LSLCCYPENWQGQCEESGRGVRILERTAQAQCRSKVEIGLSKQRRRSKAAIVEDSVQSRHNSRHVPHLQKAASIANTQSGTQKRKCGAHADRALNGVSSEFGRQQGR